MKLKTFLNALIFNLLVTFIYGQNQTDSVQVAEDELPIVVYYDKGESHRYSITKGKINYKGDVATDSSESVKYVSLIVSDSTEDGYIIEVLDESFTSNDNSINTLLKNPKLNDIYLKYANFRLKYQLSPYGEFKEFKNIEQMCSLMSDVLDSLQTVLGKGEMTNEAYKNLKQIYTQPAAVVNNLGLEYQLMYQFHGKQYKLDTLLEYEDGVENLFDPNGDNIPAWSTIQVSINEKDSNYAVIKHTLEMDPDTTTKLVKQLLAKLNPTITKDSEFEKLKMEVYDEVIIDLHLPSGWVTNMFRRRVITSKESENDKNPHIKVEYTEVSINDD